MNWKCYIDMDGVLCKCHEQVLKDFGITEAQDPYRLKENKGNWQLREILGIPKKEFFKGFDQDFFANLEWTDEGQEILDTCFYLYGEENCCILTSPTLNPGCVPGKRQWVQNNIGRGFERKMGVISAKEMFAHPYAVLVDDKDSNIKNFVRAQGKGILIPRPWNSLHGNECDIINSLEKMTYNIFNGTYTNNLPLSILMED